MTEQEITNILDAPINEAAIKFKVQTVSRNKDKALLVAYVDARTVQSRLDSAFGKFGWQNKVRALEVPVIKPDLDSLKLIFEGDLRKIKEYYLDYFRQKFIHSLGIWCDEKKQWIWHEDGASDTDVASTKGGISTSFRRVAVHVGVARGFYDLDDMWVNISTSGSRGQESFYWSGATYYYTKPKLPGWASESETEPETISLAGFTAESWEDLLVHMKADERVADAITATGAMVLDGVKSWEDAGKSAKVICEQLVKYFG